MLLKILINWYQTSCSPVTTGATVLGSIEETWVPAKGLVGKGTLKRLEVQEILKTWGTGITTLQHASRNQLWINPFMLPKVTLCRKRADRVYTSPSTWHVVGACWIFTRRINKWTYQEVMYQKSFLRAKRRINFPKNLLVFCWIWDCSLENFQNMQQRHV